jgi:TATA-box binding protein (TBP) (component of TFIID and TFIIIB)
MYHPKTVILLFTSGKLVCTGGKTIQTHTIPYMEFTPHYKKRSDDTKTTKMNNYNLFFSFNAKQVCIPSS